MTDVGTTARRAMSPMRRLRIFEAHGGRCILCELRIQVGQAWTIEHKRALGLGGEDTDENCGPAHETCRRVKDKDDLAKIAKCKRVKARHLGIRKPPAFRSKWKRKLNGSTVLREAT